MLITVSAALILGAVTATLIWARRVSVLAALVVWLSGFTAAATAIAPPVRALISTAVTAVH